MLWIESTHFVNSLVSFSQAVFYSTTLLQFVLLVTTVCCDTLFVNYIRVCTNVSVYEFLHHEPFPRQFLYDLPLPDKLIQKNISEQNFVPHDMKLQVVLAS